MEVLNKITLMSSHAFTKAVNPTGWYVSEKADGVRSMYLNGIFMSRAHNIIHAPEEFSSKFPRDVVLDGELFTKRQDFSHCSSITSKNNPIEAEWNEITFMVFDLPLVQKPFNERLEMMKKICIGIPNLSIVEQILVTSPEHLEEIHGRLVKEGAEGSMIRKFDAYYEQKRSRSILKYKNHDDDEVIVEGFEYGNGKYCTVMGKLNIRWQNVDGRYPGLFKVGGGFNDYERTNHQTLFPVGTVLKIKYWGLTVIGKARQPIYIGKREI